MAVYSFNRTHFVDGSEATWKSKPGAQHQVWEANKQFGYIQCYVTSVRLPSERISQAKLRKTKGKQAARDMGSCRDGREDIPGCEITICKGKEQSTKQGRILFHEVPPTTLLGG